MFKYVSLPALPLYIGTRKSPLALAQCGHVRAQLQAAHALDDTAIVLEAMATTGDAILDRPLFEAGGKGLFTKELDRALLDRRIDIAVHSAKDMPTRLPEGLTIAGYLPREDARDVFISRHGGGLEGLPEAAKVGTASLRRSALVRRKRPDAVLALLRGNIGTRLAKLRQGAFDATLLAYAGLKRLGLMQSGGQLAGFEEGSVTVLEEDGFIPAVGQGAIALVVRTDEPLLEAFLAPVLCPKTALALACERAFLETLDGSCRTPLAGFARVEDDGGGHTRLAFAGALYSVPGAQLDQMHEVLKPGALVREHLVRKVMVLEACSGAAALGHARAFGLMCAKAIKPQ